MEAFKLNRAKEVCFLNGRFLFQKEQVEDRLKFYETGELPKKNLEVMIEALEAVKEENLAFQVSKKKDKKKKRKAAEMEAEDAAEEVQAPVEEEEKPKKKKKKMEEVEPEPEVEADVTASEK